MHTILKFPDMVSIGNFHWGYLLVNEVYRWDHDDGHIFFMKILSSVQLLFKMSSAKQSWRSGIINLIKGQCISYRINQAWHDLVKKIIANLIYQRIFLMYVSTSYHVRRFEASFFTDESCLGKKNLHLGNNGKVAFDKTLWGYMNRVDWDFFPYESNAVDDECLPDTLGDTDSDVKSILYIFLKNNMDIVIFAHLKINFIKNKFDKLCDMIKGSINVLMIPKFKLDKNIYWWGVSNWRLQCTILIRLGESWGWYHAICQQWYSCQITFTWY